MCEDQVWLFWIHILCLLHPELALMSSHLELLSSFAISHSSRPHVHPPTNERPGTLLGIFISAIAILVFNWTLILIQSS